MPRRAAGEAPWTIWSRTLPVLALVITFLVLLDRRIPGRTGAVPGSASAGGLTAGLDGRAVGGPAGETTGEPAGGPAAAAALLGPRLALFDLLEAAEPEDLAAGQRAGGSLEHARAGGRAAGPPASEEEASARERLKDAEAAWAELLDALPRRRGLARSLRQSAADTAARPMDREGALRVELLDARAALAEGRPYVACWRLQALLAEPDLPSGIDRELLAADLDLARAAARSAAAGADEAGLAADLFAEEISGPLAGLRSPEAAWRCEAGLWCALAAERCCAGSTQAPGEAPGLRELAAGFLALEAPGALAAEACADLVAWAMARATGAEVRGDAESALALTRALHGLLVTADGADAPALTGLEARVLEARGRDGLIEGSVTAAADLRAAAEKPLALSQAASGARAARLRSEAAEVLELAGDPAAVLATLPPSGGPLAGDTLRLARARLALRDARGAAQLLDPLLAAPLDSRRDASRGGLGPPLEEARLLRAVARLELAASLPPESGEAAAFDRGAEGDLLVLLENLAPVSEVCRAALYERALQLHRRALESALEEGRARSSAADAVGPRALLVQASIHLDRILAAGATPSLTAVVLDRLSRIEERLGRLDRAYELVDRLAAIRPEDLARPESSRLLALILLPRREIEEAIASAAFRKADIAFSRRDEAAALADYRSALCLHGESVLASWAHLRVAAILRARGDRRASRDALELARASSEGLASLAAGPAATALLSRWRRVLRDRLDNWDDRP